MDNVIIFSERQRFKQVWVWLILIPINGFIIYGIFKHLSERQCVYTPEFLIPISLGLLSTALILIFRLDTAIKTDGIYVRLFPIHLTFRKYLWNSISQVYVRKYNPLSEYGGWGWRYGFSGKAFNISGNKGIQIVFTNGSKLLIGTNKHEDALKVLNGIGKSLE